MNALLIDDLARAHADEVARRVGSPGQRPARAIAARAREARIVALWTGR